MIASRLIIALTRMTGEYQLSEANHFVHNIRYNVKAFIFFVANTIKLPHDIPPNHATKYLNFHQRSQGFKYRLISFE